MPELPEVETIVRDLRPHIVGQRVDAVRFSRKRLREAWRPAWSARVKGRLMASLGRRGKWIIIDLDDGTHLLVHLGMTGQLTIEDAANPLADHTHVVFVLGRRELRFRDVRRFGSIRWLKDTTALTDLLQTKLGPEPWDLEPDELHGRIADSRRSLKALLLDQTVLAGVGNIYADEALFLAGLAPTQTGDRTSMDQARGLCQAVVAVLDRAIAARGSTIRDYVGGSGLRGGYQNQMQVYGRAGEPCRKCGSTIQVQRLAGRSTHSCPKCQAGPRR